MLFRACLQRVRPSLAFLAAATAPRSLVPLVRLPAACIRPPAAAFCSIHRDSLLLSHSQNLSHSPVPKTMPAVKEERVLLPQQMVPSRYDVTLTPDLVKFDFDGKVSEMNG